MVGIDHILEKDAFPPKRAETEKIPVSGVLNLGSPSQDGMWSATPQERTIIRLTCVIRVSSILFTTNPNSAVIQHLTG